MPHRCMNCGKVFDDGAEELIKGCDECGANLFLYKKSFDDESNPSDELEETRDDVMDELDQFVEDAKVRAGGDAHLHFDLESIKVQEEGVYEINLRKLLDEVPLIVEIRDGAYHIHLASVFSKGKNKGLSVRDLGE